MLTDSLEATRDAKQKVDFLNQISELCLTYDLSLSLKSAKEASELSQRINYPEGLAMANKWLGKGNTARGKTSEALSSFMDALETYKVLNDSIDMADVYKNLANVYSNNGNSREAMRYYDIAMKIYQSLDDVRGEGDVLNNIGTIYLSMSDSDSALYYLEQSQLSYREIQDKSGMATTYTNMGFAYALKNEYEKAITYYQMSYDLALELDAKETIATALQNIGDGYMNLGDFDLAESNVKASLAISETEGYIYTTYIGSYTLGEIYEKSGRYKESIDWYHRAENINEELRSSATLNALMDVQSRQLEESQAREIERINAANEERIQAEKFKNLLYLSLAVLALVILLGLSYYFLKRHKAIMQIAMQSEEINKQKEQIEKQSEKIKQVNDTLRHRNARLRELNENKSYMMSVVAHDLKSPLNQINGLANVIKLDQDNLTETQKECLENIGASSQRLRLLVDKILESRNIDKRQENITIEPIDINKIAGDLINDFETLATAKKIKIKSHSSINGSRVKADKHYLRQVLDNLLSNAIKFSPPGEEVELNLHEEGDKVMAEVIDHGPGLTDGDKQKLFQEYAVLSAKPTGDESSTGLGLAIVKNYVEKMGGEMWCESNPGQGAAFKLSLERI